VVGRTDPCIGEIETDAERRGVAVARLCHGEQQLAVRPLENAVVGIPHVARS
jgi:hypothetical protein